MNKTLKKGIALLMCITSVLTAATGCTVTISGDAQSVIDEWSSNIGAAVDTVGEIANAADLYINMQDMYFGYNEEPNVTNMGGITLEQYTLHFGIKGKFYLTEEVVFTYEGEATEDTEMSVRSIREELILQEGTSWEDFIRYTNYAAEQLTFSQTGTEQDDEGNELTYFDIKANSDTALILIGEVDGKTRAAFAEAVNSSLADLNNEYKKLYQKDMLTYEEVKDDIPT